MTFVKGMVSPNPKGRGLHRHSSLTIKGRVERFLSKNMSALKLQEIYNDLNSKDKLEMLSLLLPYIVSKAPTMDFNKLSDADLQTLHSMVMESVEKNQSVNLIPVSNGRQKEAN